MTVEVDDTFNVPSLPPSVKVILVQEKPPPELAGLTKFVKLQWYLFA